MSISKSKIEELEKTLNEITATFADVSGKKMFGCHALWVIGNVLKLRTSTSRSIS
jgi:hypothetical protein